MMSTCPSGDRVPPRFGPQVALGPEGNRRFDVLTHRPEFADRVREACGPRRITVTVFHDISDWLLNRTATTLLMNDPDLLRVLRDVAPLVFLGVEVILVQDEWINPRRAAKKLGCSRVIFVEDIGLL